MILIKNDEKFYQFLGLCQRAGRMASGELACEKAILAKAAQLMILSEDSSPNTKKKFINMCNFRGIDYIIHGTKNELGRAIGKSLRSALVIQDREFKRMIVNELTKTKDQPGGEQ